MTDSRAVLDHGFVRLDGCLASDLSVVNSARVSFDIRHEEMELSDSKLISYLMKNRHGTPFEHNCFRFHIKCPIFVAREWMRHRIGSFNEWSARYSTLKPEFYIPEMKNVRKRVGAAGHYTYEPVSSRTAINFKHHLEQQAKNAYSLYEAALLGDEMEYDDRVAPEMARLCLPVNIYTQFYWTVNARSLMNFLSLRNAETAQWEIQQYAKAIERFFSAHMAHTWTAFTANGRVAP